MIRFSYISLGVSVLKLADRYSSLFQTSCEQAVLPYHFIRKKNAFIRVVNDVCQTFYIERLGRGPGTHVCRIGFCVLPLCQKLDAETIEKGVGLYYLRKFELSGEEELDGWRYTSTQEDASRCANEIIRYLNQYLIPFFERANCAERAFDELISLEALFEANRQLYLRLAGIEDLACAGVGFSVLDGTKCDMALKNGNYAYVKMKWQALLQQNQQAYENAKSFLSERLLSERMDRIQRLENELSLLAAEKFSYFQQLIEENESYSRQQLKRYISE